MKSTKLAELGLLFHIVQDYVESNPVLQNPLEKFLDNVEKRCLTRGWRELILVDFPDLGKLVDRSLSSGYLDLSKIPGSFGKLNSPEAFQRSWVYQQLLVQLYHPNGRLDSESVEISDIFFVRQILLAYKKYDQDCTVERTADAVKTFLDIEETMREPSGSWHSDFYVPHRFRFADSAIAECANADIVRAMHVLDRTFAYTLPASEVEYHGLRPRHGPGAVSDARTGTDKYLFNNWPSKLDQVFPAWRFMHHTEEAFNGSDASYSSKEPPARLIAVPKTYKGPRLIASEPTAHQFLQQGLMGWLRQALPKTPLRNCVNFADQGPSRDAALLGSKTGVNATVDLSSASDRLSCWAVERAFGANQSLLKALHAVRTRTIVDGTGTTPFELRIKKFAAQGSAVTFPVQTIIYATVAIAAVLMDSGEVVTKRSVERASRKVRVFGDDIIIPSSAVSLLVSSLHYLGLRVNWDKTHDRGFYRESCGLDGYKGIDITPVYVTSHRPGTDAKSVSSWVEVSNNFHRSGMWQTSSWMIGQLAHNVANKLIISDEAGDGIRLFTFSRGTSVRKTKVRYSSALHRTEALVLGTRTRQKKKSRGSWQDLHDYFLQAPSPDSKWVHGYTTRTTVQLCTVWVPVGR